MRNLDAITPNSQPQRRAYKAGEYELLYGGSAFGGKTFWLVTDALPYVDVPNFTGVIFRRAFPELRRYILPLTHRIYPQLGGTYNVQSKTWTFPAGEGGREPATIELGYMQYPQSWLQYRASYTYQAYDELTAFLEEQWTMMRPWNRTSCPIAPYRRATTNPGDVGHAWVKKYFVDTCPPVPDGDLRWSEEARIWWQPMAPGPTYYWRDPEDPSRVLTRKFIPARIFDNVHGMRADPEYLTKLLALPKEKRRALLEGDWNVFEGAFFPEIREEYHKIRPISLPSGCEIIGAIDYGNPSVVELAFIDYLGNVVFFAESYITDASPEDRASAMADLLLEWKVGPITVLYDTDMAINLKYYQPTEYTPIEVFQSVLMQRLSENMPSLEPVSKEPRREWRKTSNETVRQLLSWKVLPGGKRKGPKLFITDDCPHLWESITNLVHDPTSQKGMDYKQGRSVEDHPFEACLRGDTLVATTNGDKLIRDLVGSEGYCYCYRHDKGRIGATRFHSVRPSGVKPLFRVAFEDGTFVETTADHRFLMRDGKTYQRCDELTSGDRLMPLYRHVAAGGYLQVRTQDKTRGKMQAGALVYRDVVADVLPGFEVHHRDNNPMNNDPINLQAVTRAQHCRISADQRRLGVARGNSRPNFAYASAEQVFARRQQHVADIRPMTREWHNSDAARAVAQRAGRMATERCYGPMAARVEKACVVCGSKYETWAKNSARSLYCSTPCNRRAQYRNPANQRTRVCSNCGKEFQVYRTSRTAHCSRSCGHAGFFNHRVATVTAVGEDEVFDLTTDSGNFGANGVIVHNCKSIVMRMSRPPKPDPERVAALAFGMAVAQPERWEAGCG